MEVDIANIGEFIQKVGVPVAILGATFWGVWHAVKWVGSAILLPLSTKHLEFLEYQIQHSKRTTDAITALSVSTDSISRYTEQIHQGQSEIREFQEMIVDTQNTIVATQNRTLSTAERIANSMKHPSVEIVTGPVTVQALERQREQLEAEIERLKCETESGE